MNNPYSSSISELKVAPVAEVIEDSYENSKWILGLLACFIAYVILSGTMIHFAEKDWSLKRSYYFTVINMTTVGFGDVVPLTPIGKIIAGINSVLGLLLFGVIVAVISMALQRRESPLKSAIDNGQSKKSYLTQNSSYHLNSNSAYLEAVQKIIDESVLDIINKHNKNMVEEIQAKIYKEVISSHINPTESPDKNSHSL